MLCALIMAGGSGKRFWPLSTDEHPKQLLKLFSEKSMIRETVDRILPMIDAENIYIGTNILQAKGIKEELPMLPEENIIIEPAFKDTAAAIGFGTMFIKERVENATMVVLASDHLVADQEGFRETLAIAVNDAETNGTIVTLGIKPSKAETGYGYIKVNGEADLKSVCDVADFLEKPSLDKAMEYVAAGNYLWNSGMFIFSAATIMASIESYMPNHYKVLQKINDPISERLHGEDLANKTRDFFDEFEKISIDYGVMEKSDKIRVIPSEFGWNDIGSFTAFEDVYEKEDGKNVVKNSEFAEVDSEGNIIMSDNMEIKAIGLKDMIVIQTGGKLLICDKNRVDEIKKLV